MRATMTRQEFIDKWDAGWHNGQSIKSDLNAVIDGEVNSRFLNPSEQEIKIAKQEAELQKLKELLTKIDSWH